MDANLQGPLKELAEALHRAIEGSPDVEEALSSLRETGFQAVLLLEVTVALSKAGGADAIDVASPPDADPGSQPAEPEWLIQIPASEATVPPGDREFLRSLRIRLD